MRGSQGQSQRQRRTMTERQIRAIHGSGRKGQRKGSRMRTNRKYTDRQRESQRERDTSKETDRTYRNEQANRKKQTERDRQRDKHIERKAFAPATCMSA